MAANLKKPLQDEHFSDWQGRPLRVDFASLLEEILNGR